ncbi:hypothetical protein C9439_05765 [archaeon SCG-AAA382B04]|nr:hypothetical protein C9439_05765 [archaeon SCG-AAA382B04]
MVRYSRTTLALLIGLVAMAITGILLFLFYPIIVSIVLEIFPWLAEIVLLVVTFVFLWAFLYFVISLIVAIYYAISKPMKIEESDYSMDSTKSSGEKQSGNYRSQEKKKDP